jgi:hypothetical protein
MVKSRSPYRLKRGNKNARIDYDENEPESNIAQSHYFKDLAQK